MLRSVLLFLLPAAALILVTAGLTLWMGGEARGLAMLIPGVTCLVIQAAAAPRDA